MNFLLNVILILVCDLVLTLYLINSVYFRPVNFMGDVDVWNIALFVFLVSSIFGLLFAIAVFIAEKLLYCGKKEFPPNERAIRLGIISSILLFASLLLHTFHFLNFFIGVILILLLFVGIIILK